MWEYTRPDELYHNQYQKGLHWKWKKKKKTLKPEDIKPQDFNNFDVYLKNRRNAEAVEAHPIDPKRGGFTGYGKRFAQRNVQRVSKDAKSQLRKNKLDELDGKRQPTRKKNTATRTAVIRIIGTNANAQYEKGKREYYRKKSKKVVSKVAGKMVKRRAR